MNNTFIAAALLTVVLGLCAGSFGATPYADLVRGDRPVIQQSNDDQAVPGATPLLGRAARHAGVVGTSERLKPGGDFTLEWWQFVPSIDAPGPTLRIGDFAFGVRPLPKDKPKDPTRAAYAANDSLHTKTLIYPGRWYYLAFVVHGGAGQFFVNGQPDGEPVKLSSKAGNELRVEPGPA